MWSSLKTEAIILSVEPHREADRKYRALTPGYGKIEFIGRGARKGKAKLAPHLDLFAIVDLEIIRGAKQFTVIGVERKESFTGLSTSLEHRLLASAAGALLDKTVKPDFEDKELYDEFLHLLTFLNKVPSLPLARNTLLLGGFLLRLLRQLGYDLELSNCLSCKDDIHPLSFRWHDGRGGLVCTNCVLSSPADWFQARPLEVEIVTLLRFARDASYSDLLRPALKADHIGAFATCVNDLMRLHVPGYNDLTYWHLIPSTS
jgi:DNA repair protein RecO (recombination protein O)